MLDNEMNKNEQVKVARFHESLASMPIDCGSAAMSMPEMPKGGLLVKVCYAGICYSEGYIRKGHLRPKLPGFEVSGIIEEVSNDLPNCNYMPGDRVTIYPGEDVMNEGSLEYISVRNPEDIIQLPNNIPLDVASMLPGSALTAYNAVLKAKPHVEKLQTVKSHVNVLIVGAGGVGLWSLRLANYLLGTDNSNVRLFVADNSIDKLITAQEHTCHDIIHWCEEDHEQYIIERTLDACRGGVDVVVDFVGSPRTMMRTLRVLNREGLILVGGNAMSEVSINLNTLAAKQQSIVGIPKGTAQQLQEIVTVLAENKVQPPCFSVHNMENANEVIDELAQCRLTGRAILKIGVANTSHTGHTTTDITDN